MSSRLAIGIVAAAIAPLPAAAAAQPAATPPAAAPLCGIAAPDVAGLRAAAAADKRFAAAGSDERQETFSSEELQAIWTFVTAKHPAYPAAVCRQVVDKGGTMQIERQIRCEAAADACAAFAAELDRMDDGSGDAQ